MHKLTRAALAAVVGLLLLVPAFADEMTRSPGGEMLTAPAPETEPPLFKQILEAVDQACPTKLEVIQHYLASQTDLKSGRVKLLVGDLPQAFSDAWRRGLRMPTVPVSGVVGQPLDLSRLGGGAFVDVTEFGANGCAMSRTIMPALIWTALLRAAAGVGI